MTDLAAAYDLPEFLEMGIAAVRLLQGVLYAEDIAAWDALLASEVELTNYFARIGLVVVIDRSEGLAYLKQVADEERTGGYERLPRLFRRTPLGYDATLLCVLLRDEYVDSRTKIWITNAASSASMPFSMDGSHSFLRKLTRCNFANACTPPLNDWKNCERRPKLDRPFHQVGIISVLEQHSDVRNIFTEPNRPMCLRKVGPQSFKVDRP
jgi:hypothetical protein